MKQQKECAYCEYVCEKEDMYLIGDEYYCLDCVGICDNCGSIELCDELTIVNYGRDDLRYVCSDCLNTDSFFQCRSCDEYYTSNSYWGSYLGSPICEHCSENYEVCEQCDNVFPAGELEYCSRTDEYLCIDCIRDADCDVENIVNEYSYKPSPVFFGDSNENYFLGIELEVDNEGDTYNPDRVYEAAEYLNDNYGEKLYLKRDSSLSRGFEIVSHPCTPEYHFNEFGWDDIMKVCKTHALLSHDTSTCGLHIHLSRRYFGDSQDEQDLHIAKLILLISKFYDSHILKFSRRKEHELSWCANPELNYESHDTEATIVDKMKCCKSKGRYQAVNLENTNTIEFRIFKGTLNINTFLAAIQFVVTISSFAKQIKLSDIPFTSWRDIFMHSDFPELNNYLKNKELI